jgi:ribosome maturation factor RimP
MAKSNTGIAARVRPALEPVVESLGYRIWDIAYVKEGADFYLRITIDRDEGVDIDGCELVHRAIDPVLDEIDPIQDAYYLQVESPGLERELRTPEHFIYCNGEKIVVKLYKAIDGQKMLTGVLSTTDGKEITLTNATGVVTLPVESVAKANILFEFN